VSQYQPPFTFTNAIVASVARISERLGAWTALRTTTLSPQLRRGHRIQTIQASLAIEHNTLSVEQALNIVLQENDMVSGGVNIKLVGWGDIDLSFIRREMICLGRIISGELTNTDKKGVAA